jgi:hypothetical protein
MVLVTLNTADVFFRRAYDPLPQAFVRAANVPADERAKQYRDWRDACDWIRQHTPDDAVFITPKSQQSFKWYAERAEVVCWKDVPQDARAIVEWRDRLGKVFPRRVRWYGLAAHTTEGLLDLGRRYGASYVVVDRTRSSRGLALPRVYPRPSQTESAYEVYRLPEAGTFARQGGRGDDG